MAITNYTYEDSEGISHELEITYQVHPYRGASHFNPSEGGPEIQKIMDENGDEIDEDSLPAKVLQEINEKIAEDEPDEYDQDED